MESGCPRLLIPVPEPARSGGLELFAPDARNLAAQHLGPSLEALEARAGVQSQVHAIKTNFWDGFVVAHLKGPQTSESESFWRCLSFRFPGLAQENQCVEYHKDVAVLFPVRRHSVLPTNQQVVIRRSLRRMRPD